MTKTGICEGKADAAENLAVGKRLRGRQGAEQGERERVNLE